MPGRRKGLSGKNDRALDETMSTGLWHAVTVEQAMTWVIAPKGYQETPS